MQQTHKTNQLPTLSIMLCNVCSNINVDELIPAPALFRAGVVSGTGHHARYEDVENAAKNGCLLCKIIDGSLTRLSKQQAKINRMRKFPVKLKMLLHGNQNPGYQGGTKLFVTCGGEIIANFEAYAPRGRTKGRYQAPY
jgi:hypothetical protein